MQHILPEYFWREPCKRDIDLDPVMKHYFIGQLINHIKTLPYSSFAYILQLIDNRLTMYNNND